MHNLNDPRITSYAMNEMSSEEKAQFESEMKHNPELADAVKAVEETSYVLKTELQKETLPSWQVKTPEAGETVSFWQKFRIPIYFAAPLTVAAGTYLVGSHLLQGVLEEKIQQQENMVASNEYQAPPAEPNPTIATGTPTSVAKLEKRDAKKFQRKNDPSEVDSIANVGTISEMEESLSQPVKPQAKSPEKPSINSPAKSRIRAKKKSFSVSNKRGRSNQYFADQGFGGSIASGRVAAKKIAPASPPMGRSDLPQSESGNRESYDHISENQFKKVSDHPLSTFSIDVDTASYANVRRLLNQRALPPKGAVRIEEMINYFDYNYSEPTGEHPLAVHTELHQAPWNGKNHLFKVGIKGRSIQWNSKGSNLVFLLDVSGSMRGPHRLPLVKKAFRLLIDNLTEKDRVAIIVYAGSSGMVLPSTGGDKKSEILAALDRLSAGGSTNGGAGIDLAYKTAQANYIKGGVNRVVLATDGDFNVGTSSKSALIDLVQEKAKSGVFLSVLGFGSGNLQDDRMESLANKGNGNYSYIDSVKEAKKVLVEEMGGTLVTIAKDVKLQIEFNPVKVAGYRLLGYENRLLAKEDFNNDQKDAGELGAGHTVTALYELIPAGQPVKGSVDALKYQPVKVTPSPATQNQHSDEWLTVKLRYKQPSKDKSQLLSQALKGKAKEFATASDDFKWASAVAGFGMLLRQSEFKGDATYDSVREWAIEGKGADKKGYRHEFIQLVDQAKHLAPADKK